MLSCSLRFFCFEKSDTLARVAKLADALDLGSCALNGVGVQLPPLAFIEEMTARRVCHSDVFGLFFCALYTCFGTQCDSAVGVEIPEAGFSADSFGSSIAVP